MAENTLVLFLSDNGMALPFAKTNCYLHSDGEIVMLPEPASAVLLAFAGLVALRRRR